MRELSLGEPLNDDDFKNWVTEALREIERASHEYGKEGTEAVSNAASDANPLMDGTAAPGTGTSWSREDHIHPTDTSRAPLASPAFTGNPTAPTPTALDDDTSIATTAWVNDAIAAGIAGLQSQTAGYESAWSSSTPTPTAQSGTFTSVSASVRYKIIGKIALFIVTVNITTNGTAAGYVNCPLPFTIGGKDVVIAGRASLVSGKMLQGLALAGGANLVIWNYDNTYPGASGEKLALSGIAEIA